MPSVILSDNGVSSGSAGLKTTASNDGILVLQTTTSGGTATNAIYIDTSQNVGIGTSSPSNRLSVVSASGSDGFISISSPTTDTAGFSVNGGTDSNKGAIVRFQKGASTKWTMGTDSAIIGGTSDNFHLYSGGANAILFSTNATERMRVNAGAPILCLSGGNTSATGTGIAFPATQSASSDANTLDDYEEGTWTVTATPSTSGSITLSGSTNTGSYIKVGRMVTVMAGVNVSALSSPVGKISINLPFTPVSGSQRDGWGAPSIMLNNTSSSGVNTFVALLEQASNVIGIYLGTGTSVSATSAQQLTTNTEIFFTLTYKTST